MYLSAQESDSSTPMVAHYQHILDLEPGVDHVALRRGQYALRAVSPEGASSPWKIFGPYPDAAIDERLGDGTIDRQQGGIQRGSFD